MAFNDIRRHLCMCFTVRATRYSSHRTTLGHPASCLTVTLLKSDRRRWCVGGGDGGDLAHLLLELLELLGVGVFRHKLQRRVHLDRSVAVRGRPVWHPLKHTNSQYDESRRHTDIG